MHSRLAFTFASLALPLLLALAPSCKRDDAGGSASSAPTGADGSTAAAPGAVPSSDTNAPALPGATGPSFEGAITMRITDGKRPPQEITMLSKGNKVRVEIPVKSGETAHSIFDPSTGKALVIMDDRHLALTMTVPPPSSGPTKGLPPTVTKSGKHETIAGHDCEDWDVVEAQDGKHEQLCVAEGMIFFDFTAMAPPDSTGASMGTWLAELRDKKEFPMRALTLDKSGKETSRMEVTKIESKPLDDALFVAPKGYIQTDLSKMGNVAGGLFPKVLPR